jgi:ribosomal protein L40E
MAARRELIVNRRLIDRQHVRKRLQVAHLASQAFSMLASQCLFCDHVNPAGAKFCNDCGSPLHVKRCSQCEAVNDQAAENCSKCGTEFPVLSKRSETPMSSARDIAPASPAFSEGLPFRLDFNLNEFPKPAPSAAKVTAAPPASVVPEPAIATASSPAPQPARPAATIELDKLDPTREPRSLGGAVTSLATSGQRATAKVPLGNFGAAAELGPMSRAALVVLPTLALIAIGIFAYYVYSHSVQLDERQGAQAVSDAPADITTGGPPTKPTPKIGVTASSAPSASLGTGSVAAIGTAKPAPPVEPSTAITISPVGQGTAAATGPNDAGSQTPSPNEPHRQVSTSDQVSPAQQFADKAEGLVKKPSAATAAAGDLRDRTMPPAGNEVTAKHSATSRPTRMYPAASAAGSVQQPPLSDGRANVRPDAPRPCTAGVAALGLCSLNSTGESK